MALDFTQFAVAGALASMQRPTGPALEPIGPAGEPDAPQAPVPEIADETLKCRDLVQLYLGKRCAMTTIESTLAPTQNVSQQVIGADPRRIRLEIYVTCSASAAVGSTVRIGSQATVQAGKGQLIAFLQDGTLLIERDYRTDGDAVTRELWCNSVSTTITISTRETILTPLPVDES